MYDLRYSAASLMIDAGADRQAVSEVVGHSNPGITMRYRHVRQEQRAVAVRGLAATQGAAATDEPGWP